VKLFFFFFSFFYLFREMRLSKNDFLRKNVVYDTSLEHFSPNEAKVKHKFGVFGRNFKN